MSVRVATKDFVGLLQALVHTASDDPEQGSIAGILLHTARGYVGAEPGKATLLCGTSTNTQAAGHTTILANGACNPMLWPIGEVPAAIAVLRAMSKGNKEHTVEVRVDGGQVTIAEEENLFGEGTSYTFDLGDASRYPRGVWRLLSDVHLRPAVTDRETGAPIPVCMRTDISTAALEPFLTIAKARKETVQLYRYHQRLPVQVVIGWNYRGVFLPDRAAEDLDSSEYPDGAVYPADLPEPPPDPKTTKASPVQLDLRHGAGLVLGGAGEAADPND